MVDIAQRRTDSVVSKHSLKWAGIAAFIGCAACCALPLLAAAALSSGTATAITSFMKPGAELIVGTVVFVLVLGVMAFRSRAKTKQGCGPMCKADGSCCARGARASS